jgi:iron complex transport system permease protein
MNSRLLLSLLTLLAVLALGGGLLAGALPLSPGEVARGLFGQGDPATVQIVQELRLPRVLAAFVCGGLLALSGVLLQALLRNPLADPYILGVSGGAAVGALAAMLLGAGLLAQQGASLVGALVAVVAVFGLGFRRGESHRLLLTGVVFSAGCGALVSLLLTLSPEAQVKGMLFWLMGDLADPQGLAAATVLLALGLVCATLASGGLDVLSAGLDKAATLGLAVGRWQAALYFAAALFTVAALQLGGSIGFVGLMMPHAVRLLGVTAHRWLVPGAALLGGAFLLLADTLARTAWSPLQLPVGIFTALLGVPVLLWLLARGR